MTQRDLAEALDLDVALVRGWEKGERFATKAHCAAMAAVQKNPPPRKSSRGRPPLAVLGDPGFQLVLRKLLVHGELRRDVERLASEYADPLDADHA